MHDQINKNLPLSLENFFTLKAEQHQHYTRRSKLNVPPVKIRTYGCNSVKLWAIQNWNNLQNILVLETAFTELSRYKFLNQIKKKISETVE